MRNKLFMFSLILLAAPVGAAPWKIDAVSSTLSFEGEQSGEKFKGSFARFTPVIEFDAAAPEKGSITVTIDMASAQVEGKDRQEGLPTADWFAVKQFPAATFVSTSIRAAEDGGKPGSKRYVAKGLLTIRGIAKEVSLPFMLTPGAGGTTLAQGELTLNRVDYGVGQGEWKGDAYIKHPVTVRFALQASR